MVSDYSRDGLLAFLREAAMAGHMNPATARSRLNAAQQLFTHLSASEAKDLRRIDVDELAARCHKLQGGTVRPEVVSVYARRLQHALTDYFGFLEDPDRFVSVGAERRTLRRRGEGAQRSDEERALEEIRLGSPNHRPDVMPIPLREGRVVYVHDLPADLTPAEARKIARVIEALAEEPGGSG